VDLTTPDTPESAQDSGPAAPQRRPAQAIWVVPFVLWAITAAITWRFAIDVPYWDSWEQTELVTGAVPFNLSSLWVQLNEHRILIQKVFEFVWARIGGWDQRIAAFFPMLFLLAAALLFARRAVRERPQLKYGQAALLVIILSLWFLNARQTDLLIWGIFFSWGVLMVAFVVFDGVWREYVAEGKRAWAMPLLVLLAVTATGQGLALCAFLILAGLLSLLKNGLPTRRMVGAALLGVAGIALYYFHYYRSPDWPSPLAGLRMPVASLKYAATYTGGVFTGLSYAPYVGVVILLLGIAAAASLCFRVGVRQASADLVSRYPLLLVATIVMGSVTLARVGLGMEQAIMTRYVPFAMLLVAGILLLGLDELTQRSPRAITPALVACVALTLASWPAAYGVSVHEARVRHDALAIYRDCRLADPNAACDDPWSPYPYPDRLRRLEALLRKQRLSFFRDANR
jgi:hypothetical protein